MGDSNFVVLPVVEPELHRRLMITSLVIMMLTADLSAVVVTIWMKALN